MNEEKEKAEHTDEEIKAAGPGGLPDNGRGCPSWPEEKRQIYADIIKTINENFDEAFMVCGIDRTNGLLVSIYANLTRSSMIGMIMTIAERNHDVFMEALMQLAMTGGPGDA